MPEWIKKFVKKPNYSKVVIVIDNLDRCDDENLLITLNTIKNFLEHKNVIFILPVDENGISAFLSKKTDNADEYLRKIFHLIIRLKEFSKNELLEFTDKINDNYSLGLNNSSIRIICQEFTSNPRKIIQFLNNYQSEVKLIEEQSKLNYVNEKFVQSNIDFFIKLLIIKNEWKTLYNEILYDKKLLNKINNVITNLEPDNDGLYSVDRSNVKLNDTQRNFFFSTQEIHCNNIDPFILNIDLDKDIPDELEDFIRNGNYSSIVEYLGSEDNTLNEYKLIKKIGDVFSSLTFKHREYSFIALPVLKLLMNFVLDEKQDEFKNVLIKKKDEFTFLKSLFKDSKIETLFDKFDFEELTKATKWFSDHVNDDLYKSYINYYKKNIFSSGTTVDKEVDKIDFYFQTFDKDKIKDVKNDFSKKLLSTPEMTDIGSLEDYNIAQNVITKTTYRTICRKLKNGAIEKSEYQYSNLCFIYATNNNTDKVAKENLLSYFFNELEEFYKTEDIGENVYADYQSYFDKINSLLNAQTSIELTSTFKEVIENINTHFYLQYDVDFNEDELLDIFTSFFELTKNLIFYTKNFKSIAYRTTYFDDYLKTDYSSKISAKICDILYQDVDKHLVYDYPFSETLILHYEEFKKPNIPYAKPLMLMVEKTNKEKGLSGEEIDRVILRTINLFAIKKREPYISYLKRLKKTAGKSFLEILNKGTGVYNNHYIKSVKLLKDELFYGESIFNFLNSELSKSNGSFSTFKSNLKEVSNIFTTNEQVSFLQEIIDNSNSKVYKWLRSSYNILDKKVFDVYLSNLLNSHKTRIVGNNDFFEWIIKIPKEKFYKKQKKQYIEYLKSLDIRHKTYKPKKEKALEYLT